MSAEHWVAALSFFGTCAALAYLVWPGTHPVQYPVMEAPSNPHPVLLLRNRRRVRVPLRLIRR